jgi:hypothetical protein
MMDMSDTSDPTILPSPWERQPGETAKSYGAFCVFRDLGPRRSLSECCLRFYGEGRANLAQISTWSAKFRWVERCRAWDDHLDALARQEQEQQRKEMVERHASTAKAAVEKAAEAVAKIVPADLKPTDIIKWLVEAAKLERLSRGEPETIQEQRGENHVTIDIFQQVEQYATVLQSRREQQQREQRLLASPVPGDGAAKQVDTPPANGQAGGVPDAR